MKIFIKALTWGLIAFLVVQCLARLIWSGVYTLFDMEK
jgi:hypothetical protein